ncbi:MAG: hypothetical protein ACHQC8_02620 [Solirubrobacterales bacterium]
MPPCEHREFASLVVVTRITKSDTDLTVIGYSANVKVACEECNERFLFRVGNIDSLELTVNLRPVSQARTAPGVN